MSIIDINPPPTALPGKLYGVDELTGLLVMKNPSLQDVLACRGIFIEYTHSGKANKMLLLGRSFDEYARVCTFVGSDFSTPTTAALLAAQFVKYSMTCNWYIALQRGKVNGRVTGGYVNPVGTAQAFTVTAAYAVPHSLLAGHWFTYGDGPIHKTYMVSTQGNQPANDGNLQFSANAVAIKSNSPYGPDLQTSITENSSWFNGSAGEQGERALPTYAAPGKASKTYRQMITAILATVDIGDANDLKPGMERLIHSKLASMGISLDSYVVVPVVFGGYANDLRVLGDAVAWNYSAGYAPYGSWYTADNSTVTPFGNTSVCNAGLVPLADGQYRMPICLIGDATDPVSPMFEARPYSYANGVPAAKWSNVSVALPATIDGRNVRSVLGSQPFGCFYNMDRTPRVLSGPDFDLQSRLNSVWRYSRATNIADPTAAYVEGSATIEAQQQSFITGVNGADRSSMEISTIGDTMAVTPRKLIAAILDGFVSDGSDIDISEAAVNKVFADYALCLNGRVDVTV